jgi:3',5'-cyclic AMP phosphodiesterase CpdA
MRLAHISDFHCTKLTLNPLHLFPKRIFGHLHWIFGRKNSFSTLPLEELSHLFLNLKVDLILLGGDFTSSSMHEEFRFAKSLIEKMNAPSIALPGNHDHYTLRSYKEGRFYQYFTNPNPTLGSLPKIGVEAQKIDSSLWVVSLDTSVPNKATSSRGMFSETQEKQLEKILSQIPKEDKIILFNHFPFFQQEDPKRTLERGEALQEIIRKNFNIVLYLHGHTHRHCVADLRSNNLPIILDSGSCCQKANATWNLIDIEPNRCVVTPYEWKSMWKPKTAKEFIWNR